MIEHLIVHLTQVVRHLGPVEAVDETVLELTVWICHGSVREPRRLGDAIDDIHPEPVTPFVQPEPHHVPDRVADLWVLPIEVRLRNIEHVQVVFLQLLVPFPARSPENRAPIVGLFPVLAFPSPQVPVFLRPSLHGVLEPCMLVGSVVDDEIHDDFEPDPMRFLE